MIAIYFKRNRSNFKMWFDCLKNLIKKYIYNVDLRKSSIEMVNDGLIKALNTGGIKYKIIQNIHEINQEDLVISLGLDVDIFNKYKLENPVIAGIGLMTHPSDSIEFFEKPFLKAYLQHSNWTVNLYNNFLQREICHIWPVGIDTDKWMDPIESDKQIDFLIYVKFLWLNEDKIVLLSHVVEQLKLLNFKIQIIKYGEYTHLEYKHSLSLSRAMVFLCEHESQGLAYQEALSMNVPVLAWDQGIWLDPKYTDSTSATIIASSVPYFDSSCGLTFCGINDFNDIIIEFIKMKESFTPRDFVLMNLSYEKSCQYLIDIIANLKLDKYIEKYEK